MYSGHVPKNGAPKEQPYNSQEAAPILFEIPMMNSYMVGKSIVCACRKDQRTTLFEIPI